MTATFSAFAAAILLSSWVPSAMAVDFDRLFDEELESRQIEFERAGKGTYRVQFEGRELIINTQNIRAEVLRDSEPSAIGRFLDDALGSVSELPEWSEAFPYLFPMIESIDVDLGSDTVSSELTDRTRVVLALYKAGGSSLRFITDSDLDAWGVTAEEAWEAARNAFGEIVAQTRIEILKAGEIELGTLHATAPHKASMILSPDLKSRIPAELGWPVLAVAPARDFVYLLRKDDKDALGRVGTVVVREFRASGYPVSTEVWELSDEGAKAIGEFPVE